MANDKGTPYEECYSIAPAEEWEAAVNAKPEFRVTRFHNGEDGGFQEENVSERGAEATVRRFLKEDDLYGIWICKLGGDDAEST